MAVQNILRKVGPTTGNGILKEFPFSFKTVRASDVVVKTSSGTSVTDEEVSAVICSHMFSQTYDICMSNL